MQLERFNYSINNIFQIVFYLYVFNMNKFKNYIIYV